MNLRYDELALILTLGALQPLTEWILGARIATFYNAAAALIVIAWIANRLRTEQGLLRSWGIRRDNFIASLPLHLGFAAAAAAAIYAWGWAHGRTPLPASFWYLLALYSLWGFAQQFALQNLLVRNLGDAVRNPFARSVLAAGCFSLAHAPSAWLMTLAFVSGVFFTLLYRRAPNLFAVGIAHGIIGALVFYLVLDQNQIEVLQEYLQ